MLALLISLCSCLDGWENPISDVQDAKTDKRLIGTWQIDEQSIGTWFDNNEPANRMMHVYEIDEHSMYMYAVTPEHRCDPASAEAHISRVAGRTFMNWRPFDCRTKKFSRYLILEYEFNGENEVIFYGMNDDFVEEAIGDKKLSGHLNIDHEYVVTATSLEIREFINNSPKEKLFDTNNPFVYKRFEGFKGTKRSLCIIF
jgi:hypothetical protein